MRSWLIIVFILSYLTISAQYVPNSAQTFQFASLVNPAFTGIENYNDFKLSYRYQWAGLGKYSPKFINLAYNVRLKQPVDLAYNSLRISDPSLLEPGNLPMQKRMVHGLGGNLFQSKVGVIESLGAGVTYSLNYPITKKCRVAVGMGGIIENRKLDLSEVTVRDPDQFYNHLLNSSTTQTDLSIRAGALVYTRKFYLGFSYLPLVNIAIQSSDLAFEEPFYRGSAQAGYAVQVNPDLVFRPSLLMLLQMNGKMAMDYNVKAYIQEKVWLGLSYRSIKSGLALIGFNFNEKFTTSYSYELSLGDFQQFNDGSHEIVLSIRFKNFKKQSQYLW